MQENNSQGQPGRGVSRTALWVAAARAVGAREPDAAVRNPDCLAERLLGKAALLDLDHPVVDALEKRYEEAMQDMEVASMVRAMTERTRFIDQALERAIAAGARQCLVVGAGFDSHAYRCRELLERVRVSMYVAEEALRATFRFFAAHAPGSSVVFDFATRTMIDGMNAVDLEKLPAAARPTVERILKMLRNEPWVFGIPLDGEKAFLAGLGLELREMVTIGSEESVRRFLTRADGTTVGAEVHARALAFQNALRQRLLTMGPAQREQAEAAMREQIRQNAYRIAEAVVPAQDGK